MKISFDTTVDRFRIVAEDGESVSTHFAAMKLAGLVYTILNFPERIVPTASGWALIDAQEAAVAATLVLPAHWEPSLDGVNNLNGAIVKKFIRKDGAECMASCDPEGNACPGTADTLRSYDADHPMNLTPTEGKE